jgi:probable LLM family oxidoreductase
MLTNTELTKSDFEIGIYTLGDIVPDPHTGELVHAKQRLQEIIEAAKIADEAGLDVFGVGEHHRLDFAVSATPVVLGAISQVTKQIKLTSATSVLSTMDPVRLFEDYATLDLLSNGRAEIIAGRGAFMESFPLFGYSLDDNTALFAENMDLFLKLNKNEHITWEGKFRSSIKNAEIAPRPVQEQLPIWVGVGGSQESATRAGKFGAGMAMAILDGDPARFKPVVDSYRKAGTDVGLNINDLKVGVTGHGYIAKTTQQAKREYYPYYSNYKKYVGRQLGIGSNMSEEEFERMVTREGALFVGSPQQIIEKILYQYEMFGHKRFVAQLDIGAIPFSKVVKGIELLATEVAPVVRREMSKVNIPY